MAELAGAHRSALVEATVAEFAAAGYEGASLNRIIRAAGISKSSFYHAVSSKAELFDVVVQMLVDDVRARWHPPAPAEFAGAAFWERVDAVLTELGALTTEDRSLGLLGQIFYLPAGSAADARGELLDTVRSWTGKVLRVGVDAGAVRNDLPVEVLAAAAFGMLRGLDEWAVTSAATVVASPLPSPTPPPSAETPNYRRRYEGVSAAPGGVGDEGWLEVAVRAPGALLRGMLAA